MTTATSSTEKLYWSAQLAAAPFPAAPATVYGFEARGASLATHAGKTSIVLPRTLFYPEGGGQLGDVGTLTLGLGSTPTREHLVRIGDTQIEEGTIHHLLEGELGAELADAFRSGAAAEFTVRGIVDETRRRDNMVQHTAQHALSRALAEAARAPTVSARLGATSCTIDVSRPGISEADLHRAEDLVNAVVMSDVAVKATFPTPEELATLDLRKQPDAEKSAAGVRVITIEGFDVTPCGGTHCARTGEIGQIRIVGTEKYKGMLRLTFHAGRRALADARAGHRLLAGLASDLTCGLQDVPVAIGKLRSDVKGLKDKLDSARNEVAALVARQVLAGLPASPGPHVVPVARPLDDLAGLRALAGKLAEDARVIAVVGGQDESSGETVVIVQRGGGAKLDCGAFVSAQAKASGGRGGGRPERAEGRFPRGTSLDVLAASARDTAMA